MCGQLSQDYQYNLLWVVNKSFHLHRLKNHAKCETATGKEDF